MDTPGPPHYVPMDGFSQKPKMRLARGPAKSRMGKSEAYVFSVCVCVCMCMCMCVCMCVFA